MTTLRHLQTPSAVLPLLVFLSGCGGDGPTVVKVTGRLTYKGQPVTNAIIQFQPEYGRQSWAATDHDGRFKVNYDRHQDGAVVGKHKVWVEIRPTTPAEQEAAMLGKRIIPAKELAAFFEKYKAENTPLTAVEITKKTKELDLNLD
jgi:hypothetical protein